MSGGSICSAQRLTLDDGSDVFVKTHPAPPEGFFEVEAAGLDWLRAADDLADGQGAPVPEVLAVSADLLALEWIPAADPAPEAAERFGRELAVTHRAGADKFGGPGRDGYLGTLPLDNTTGDRWADWFVDRRLRPYLRRSVDNGALTGTDAGHVEFVLDRIEDLAGPAEPPSRTHGDLWPGNLAWSTDRVWLVDPAAHGGHRETDLALLHLWGGAPYLPRILAAYDEVAPLADGWRDRIPLHQLYVLLAHTAMLGAGYREDVLDAARQLS